MKNPLDPPNTGIKHRRLQTPLVGFETPLLKLLRKLTPLQRRQFSLMAQTSIPYLYALATCQRRSCKTDKAVLIAKASRVFQRKHGTNIVTEEMLGTMCAITVAEAAAAAATAD